MSTEKLSPRQQMISLMYLVLLAMLAMNASKDLLNAFVMLEDGIGSTNKNFSAKNEKSYKAIASAALKIESAKKLDVIAKQISKQADEIFNFIQEDKDYIVNSSGGRDEDSIPLAKDNQELAAGYYILNDVPNDKAERLKTSLNKFKDMLLGLDLVKNDKPLMKRLAKMLATKDSVIEDINHEWISLMVDHLPMAAATANLTLIQTYVRNAETEVIDKIAVSLEGDGMVVNVVNGMAVMNPAYVLTGDSIKGDIFIAAYNKDITPRIFSGVVDTTKFIGGKYETQNDKEEETNTLFKGPFKEIKSLGGKGLLRERASSPGLQDVAGVIRIAGKDKITYYNYHSSYMVAEPTATISATKMNVFYVGVPNPMSVSAPGVALDGIQVAASGLSISPSAKKGEYIVTAKVPNPKGVEVVVSKKGGGRLGGMVFRVKTLPDPVAEVMQQRSGLIASAKLKVVSTVIAKMDNFDFDLKVTVVSFDLTMNLKGDLRTLSSTSEGLTNDMKSLLSAANKGTKVYFENIKAKMPDGSVRKLGTIALTAN